MLIGRYGLNPFFRILARSGAREVMTASALLVVLGAALLMEEVGLSMAMGAFLAGLLLAESNFRHQLEADIEPFRGMLLGLFFMSVGMSIDLALVREQWLLLAIAAPAVILGKTLHHRRPVAAVRRKLARRPALGRASVHRPASSPSCCFPVAMALGLMSPAEAQPRHGARRHHHAARADPLDACSRRSSSNRREGEAQPEPAWRCRAMKASCESRVLVIGFGRFGQIVNQVLLAQGIEATVIDKDVERIRDAGRFGLQVYYGDGTRLDVLRAAGAEKAEMICICIDDPEATMKIVEIIHENFQNARSFVRAYDRIHAIELMNLDVDYQIREVFESAIVFGRAALEELGTDPEAAAAAANDVRKRDIARLVLQKEVGDHGRRRTRGRRQDRARAAHGSDRQGAEASAPRRATSSAKACSDGRQPRRRRRPTSRADAAALRRRLDHAPCPGDDRERGRRASSRSSSSIWCRFSTFPGSAIRASRPASASPRS